MIAESPIGYPQSCRVPAAGMKASKKQANGQSQILCASHKLVGLINKRWRRRPISTYWSQRHEERILRSSPLGGLASQPWMAGPALETIKMVM